MSYQQELESYLRDQRVAFQVQHHAVAYSAQEVAASEHVPGRLVAKVVMVRADARMTMLVVPAPLRVDLTKTAAALGAREVRLAPEDEFAALFPGCAVGAMSPFGNLQGLPVYVDAALADDETMICPAGTHTDTISLRYEDFARLANPTVAELCAG